MDIKHVLTRLNIDTDSDAKAVQDVRALVEGSENPLGAAKVLFTNLADPDTDFNFTDSNEARLTVACMVVDALKFGDQYDANAALKRAAEWIVRHREKNPWCFAKPEVSTTETQERGGVHVEVKTDGSLKKGSKQILAKALFESNPTLNNAELIKLFVKELDMSEAGARTYVYNCRKAVVVGK